MVAVLAGLTAVAGCQAAERPEEQGVEVILRPPAEATAATDEAAAPPAATPAPEPAAPAPTAETAEVWLERIEARAARLESLQADLRYDRTLGLEGDRQRRLGRLVYLPGTPSRFAVHFNRLIADGRGEPQDKWFIFDGQWLVERDSQQRYFRKQQVVAPDQVGQSDPLALGEGPFPLPLGARKEQVLRRFEAALAPPAQRDPPGSVHLVLTPRPGWRTELVRIDLWYDRASLLPLRVRTEDESENISLLELDLAGARLDAPVDRDVFDVREPGRGWNVEVVPWGE